MSHFQKDKFQGYVLNNSPSTRYFTDGVPISLHHKSKLVDISYGFLNIESDSGGCAGNGYMDERFFPEEMPYGEAVEAAFKMGYGMSAPLFVTEARYRYRFERAVESEIKDELNQLDKLMATAEENEQETYLKYSTNGGWTGVNVIFDQPELYNPPLVDEMEV